MPIDRFSLHCLDVQAEDEDQSPFRSWLQPQAGTDAIHSCHMNQIFKIYFSNVNS